MKERLQARKDAAASWSHLMKERYQARKDAAAQMLGNLTDLYKSYL